MVLTSSRERAESSPPRKTVKTLKKEEREKEKKKKEAEDIDGKKIKTRIPEEQPTDEELEKAKAQEMAELEKAKRRGLLKTVHVREHNRRLPKKSEEERREQ